jgi:hypothetical protein
MREFKFRAWDGEEMREVFSLQSNGDGINYRGEIVDDWKLMQFTGLRDKKTKEIYEGDIVKFNDWSDDEEVWVKEVVVFEGGAFYPVSLRTSTEFIVIGNIYENPELIKK